MNGKQLITRNYVFWPVILLLFLLVPIPAYCADEVAILLSDDEKAYETPVATFKNEIHLPVSIYNLLGNLKNAPKTMADIFAKDTKLIFALGSKAAFVAKVWTMDKQYIPVIFAMVINWQRYNLLEGQDNIAGIASEVSPGSLAEKTSQVLNLELVAKPISRPGDFKRTYKEFGREIGGFWILADPVIYTIDNISWLEKKCINDNLACIGQSKNVAKFGMLIAVDPDMHSIGSQAAAISKSIIHHKKKPKDIGVMSPLGTKIFLNLLTAEKIGLDISPAAREMASEIID